VCDLETP